MSQISVTVPETVPIKLSPLSSENLQTIQKELIIPSSVFNGIKI